MVLTDGVLGQMLEPVDFNFETIDASKLPDPKWAIGANKGRERRTVCSYDLDEGKLETMTLERAKRYKEAQEKEVLYDTRMIEDAEVVLVAYGTAARACMSAIKIAREKGIKAGLFRPITLWPFPTKEIAKLAEKAKCFLSVEMSLGQMVVDVRLAVNGKKPVYLHARPSGAMPVAEEIAAAAQSALKGSGPGLYGDFAPLN